MNYKTWKEEILSILNDISDKGFQYTEWFDKNDSFAISADELICMLYDDNLFESFIEQEELHKNDKELLKNFNNKLNQFLDSQPTSLNDTEIFYSESWNEIREEAKTIVQLLRKQID